MWQFKKKKNFFSLGEFLFYFEINKIFIIHLIYSNYPSSMIKKELKNNCIYEIHKYQNIISKTQNIMQRYFIYIMLNLTWQMSVSPILRLLILGFILELFLILRNGIIGQNIYNNVTNTEKFSLW